MSHKNANNKDFDKTTTATKALEENKMFEIFVMNRNIMIFIGNTSF